MLVTPPIPHDLQLTLTFTVNGKPVTVSTSPGRRLSRVLREDRGLTGTKVGCDAGDCGACTVLLDGNPVCACLVSAAQAEGHDITTVEGLATRPPFFDQLQKSFLHHGAAQCGACTPGMLVAATALLEKTPQPTENEVMDATGGRAVPVYRLPKDHHSSARGQHAVTFRGAAGPGLCRGNATGSARWAAESQRLGDLWRGRNSIRRLNRSRDSLTLSSRAVRVWRSARVRCQPSGHFRYFHRE